MIQTTEDKQAAFDFLASLEEYLNRCLPGPAELEKQIQAIVGKSKGTAETPHTNFAEGAFLNRFVVPHLHEFLAKGLGKEGARVALLSESFRRLPDYASGTPARSKRHPFSKVVGIQPQTVIQRWRQPHAKSLVRSCPDLALRHPCRHKIVFEGKYFAAGRGSAAETALATGIYQAFFYRGLPSIPKTAKHRPWDYDYACLLAYDATRDGSMQKAWNTIDEAVRSEGLWDGANIYVMILRGDWLSA